MTSQYRHRRSADPTKAFTQLEPGEIAVNTANRQLALGDAASGAIGNPLQLLPLRYFDTRAIYAAGDLVYYSSVVYRSIGVSGPGAFTPGQWTMLVGVIDAQYVAKAGDTMTGALTLSGNPSAGLHAAPMQYVDAQAALKVAKAGDTMTGLLVLPATVPTLGTHATNKAYVDAALAGKASVISSDTPPAGVIDNTLWFETDSGLLYVRYNDGNSTQWVVACPQPDTSLFVQRTGDTMTGPLVLPAADPTLATHSTSKAYVDKTAKSYSGKNYIINGAMMVSQENGATAGTTGNYYPVDMFSVSSSNTGAFSAAQVASVTPAGSSNRLRFSVTTADTSVGATEWCTIATAVEGYRLADLMAGTTSAKTVTIQFGVKAPAGTYCISLRNGAGRSYVAEYVIAAGETNTSVVKSVTLALDQTGTWEKTNNAALAVTWVLMCGSDNQQAAGSWFSTNKIATANQFNFMGTVGNVFELFDVSLTEGPNAPPFTVPDYASELAACQRYFHRGAHTIPGWAATTGAAFGIATHPVRMRVAPTVTFPLAASAYVVAYLTTGVACTSVALPAGYPQNSVTSTGIQFNFTVGNLPAGSGVGLVLWESVNFSARL